MCKPKSDGGLGFRTINEFNSALLAKQLWRLLQYPNSLLARVLKGRYYRKSNPMEDNKFYSPSYGWRSIISARFIMEQGLTKQVGSGTSISVWKDNWIPDVWHRTPQRWGYNYSLNLKVNHIIDPGTQNWNINLLNEFFDPIDIPLIRAIPISKVDMEERLVWTLTKSGKYTVK